jgi:transposase
VEGYSNFIGIDIGKLDFVVAVHGSKSVKSYENSSSGIGQFLTEYKDSLLNSLCILEPTGGYEIGLLFALCNQRISTHRAHTRKVKSFIRSFGNEAKTDKLDALVLARYGFDRHKSLDLFTQPSEESSQLYELVQRRHDLKQMLVAEKNRFESPRTARIKNSISGVISVLQDEIREIAEEINRLIANDDVLKKKKKLLKTVPGIGDIVANEILVLLPEIGQLTRREIASLVGLAPISKDSGKLRGYRRTGHGRKGIKPILFMAAMAARNSNSSLKVFYEGLISRGKCKMVALTALMRKIIIIANARLKIVPTT